MTEPLPPCTTIDEVIARMEELERTLSPVPGPGYGARCFNRLYMAVTRGVKQAVGEAGFFADRQDIAQLDVIFAQLYFDAVDAFAAGQSPPAAWRVVFDSSATPGILPLQFALAGMNAHINHDLPIALLRQWTAAGRRPGTGDPAYADYTKINQILQAEEAKEKALIEPADLKAIDSVDGGAIGRLDSRLAMWAVDTARAAAWHTADRLWDVRHLAPAEDAILATVDTVVAVWGESFLSPL